ncbi:MAG TPA: amino acid permease [Vicinamibacterales bacterium]|nr:amino acid permease [Vicinamibacterales bacterium]
MRAHPVAAPQPQGPTLERRLSAFDASAIVISNVIGAGIFVTPPVIAGLVPHPAAMLGVWVAGGLLAFAGAMAYAELAALRPRAGGEYVYLREAFGPIPAFLTGWTSFVAGFSGAIAAQAVGLATYLGRFVGAAGDRTPLVTIPLPGLDLVVSPQAVVAIAAIALLAAIHIRGLGPGRAVQNLLAGLKISALVAFVALGFAFGRGSTAGFTAGEAVTAGGWLLAMIPVMFTYSGWNAASYVAEEVREPGRNVPLALAMGTAAVIAIYLALNLLYLYAMPVTELAGLQRGVLDTTAERLFGTGLADLLAAFTIVSIAASMSAMTLAGPRVYFAMARDGLFPTPAARVHPRYRTPAVAIVAQSAFAALLVLSGTLSQLLIYTGFAITLFAAVAVAAVFVLRRRQAAEERPFRAWGYPVAPALFVVAGLVLVGNEIWRNPRASLAGLAVIAAGLPIYWFMRRPRRTGAR